MNQIVELIKQYPTGAFFIISAIIAGIVGCVYKMFDALVELKHGPQPTPSKTPEEIENEIGGI